MDRAKRVLAFIHPRGARLMAMTEEEKRARALLLLQQQRDQQEVPRAGPFAENTPEQDWARSPEADVNQFRGNPMDMLGEIGSAWGQWGQELPGRAGAFLEGAVEGVPIAGPMLMEGAD